MKKTMFYCTAALSCLAMQASTFEICSRNTSEVVSDCLPYDGFYIGGNIGAGDYYADIKDRDGFIETGKKWKKEDVNVVGGVQVGFDVQKDNLVLGVVGDWNATDLGRKIHQDSNAAHSLETDLNWYSTFRARAGVTFGNTLLFATGGGAVAQFKTTAKDINHLFKKHHAEWGWTAGAGAEFFVLKNITVGADALFIQFPNRKTSIFSADSLFKVNNRNSMVVGRLFINYRI